MTQIFQQMWRDEEGQDLVEYAMLLVLVVLVVLQSFPPLASTLGDAFKSGATALNG